MPEFDPHGLSRRSSNTDLSWRDNAERSDEFPGAVTTYLGHDFRLRGIRQPRKANQDHSAVHEALAEHQLTEVFVRSQQNGPSLVRLPQDLLIRNAGGELGHVDDLMAVMSQALHHRAVDTFIGDQVHADFALSG